MKLLLVFFALFAVTFATQLGPYSVVALKVAKQIFTESKVEFEVLTIQEELNGGVVRQTTNLNQVQFPEFTSTKEGTFDVYSSTATATLDDQTTASITIKVVYTSTAQTYKGINLPANSVKTVYELSWPTLKGDKFRLKANGKWSITGRDATKLLRGVEHAFIEEGNTVIGIEITKPFDLKIFFPRGVTVDGQAATLSVDAHTPTSQSASIDVVLPAGRQVVIDPVVAIETEDTTSSASYLTVFGTLIAFFFALF